MPSQTFIQWCCCTVLTCLVSASVQANMRAPNNALEPPSAALNKPSAQSALPALTVLNENLNFDCDYQHCRVEAIYRIQAASAATLTFDFILPTQSKVNAMVGGATVSTQLQQDGNWRYDRSEPRLGQYFPDTSFPLYRARFNGHLTAGVNEISVRYLQPLGQSERTYGYFTQSRFVEILTYELAPLKTWRLADNFTMNITLTTPRKRPDRDGWSLFNRRSVDCALPGQKVVKQADKWVYQARLGRNFPNRLLCLIGDDDLL